MACACVRLSSTSMHGLSSAGVCGVGQSVWASARLATVANRMPDLKSHVACQKNSTTGHHVISAVTWPPPAPCVDHAGAASFLLAHDRAA